MTDQVQQIIQNLSKTYGISEIQIRICAGVTESDIVREFEVVKWEWMEKGRPLDNFLIWLEAEARLWSRFYAGH